MFVMNIETNGSDSAVDTVRDTDFFQTMMIFIANSETIHPNGEKSKVSPRRPPVGRKGTFRPTVGQKVLFGQPLAKKYFSAHSWPKSTFRPSTF